MVIKLSIQYMLVFQMLEDVINNANDNIWNMKTGGHVFWQQILHSLMGSHFWFRLSNEKFIEPFIEKGYYPELEKDPENIMEKAELIKYKEEVRTIVEEYFKNKDDNWLKEPSILYNKLSNLEIIMMQIRHLMYHVGFCSALLRENQATQIKWIDYYGK